jgi:thiamine-phosphate pyrophosphorylase
MPAHLPFPIIYQITSGATTTTTATDHPELASILDLVERAAEVNVPLVQLREKKLSTRVLYELTTRAVSLTTKSETKVLLNDRFDVALAAGAHGVHLTSQSIDTARVRAICGADFVIGVSTHSLEEVRVARDGGADFVVFGPVFDTQSKREFGAPRGIDELRRVVDDVGPFPVVAIGGIDLENVNECFRAGANGIAAIRLLNNLVSLSSVVLDLRKRFTRSAD